MLESRHGRSSLALNIFTLEKANRVQVGDILSISQYWNETSSEKIADQVKCLAVRRASSQSRIEFLVQTKRSHEIWLDAAWFVF